MRKNLSNQYGYFLILAVIFILVIGVMGAIIAHMFAARARLSVAQMYGLRAFYIAESGLEIGGRLLTMPTLTGTPTRQSCASINGAAAVTNAAMGTGTFTLTTINSSPVLALDTLNAAQTATDTTINVASTAGFAPSGKLFVDKEVVDYAAISGNTFIGATRGVSGTVASTHASGASVSQYQCSLNSNAGVPNLTSTNHADRNLQWNVQLQDAWVGGNLSGSNFVFSHWSSPTELSWTALSVAGGSNAGNINGLSMVNNGDGWAVADEVSNNLIFLRWNGNTWTVNTVASCNGQNLLGVSMISSQQGFAVGVRYRAACAGSGPRRYTLLRWNGSTWSLLTPPTIPADNTNNQDLEAVHVIDTIGNGVGNIGFAVGAAGQILRYNGSTWVQDTSPVTSALNGVFTVSTSEAWAVGNGGVILRWNGSTWSSVSSPTTTTLNAIAMLDTNGDGLAEIGWAVGNNGRIATYNGSTWSVITSGGNNLFDVSIFDSQDVWTVGQNGTALHWDGSAWTSISSGTTRQLNGISTIGVKQKPTSAWKQIFR